VTRRQARSDCNQGAIGALTGAAWLGHVFIGSNAKTLALRVGDGLNTGRWIRLGSVDDTNLDNVTNYQRAPEPFQVVIVSNTANSEMNSTRPWRVERSCHGSMRHHETVIAGSSYADPLSVQQKLKSVHGV
jgi:hypothetical protein